jgi:membrane peptidoglycan carboxypeptidase
VLLLYNIISTAIGSITPARQLIARIVWTRFHRVRRECDDTLFHRVTGAAINFYMCIFLAHTNLFEDQKKRKEVQQMQVESYPGEVSSQPRFEVDVVETAEVVGEGEGEDVRQAVVPARLPSHSPAAVAQRLSDAVERPIAGLMYGASHLRAHPTGWRTRRHIKRKKLRINRMHEAVMERKSTLTLRNLALSLCTVVVVLSVAFALFASFMGATQQRFGSDVLRLEDMLPGDSLRLYDMHGQLTYEATDQGLQISEPYAKISPSMRNAQVAIEDQNFWKNPGYDITGIIRAAIDDLSQGYVVSGGSTITQQLIKNTLVGDKETLLRKLQEIILAPEINRYYTKEQILTMYLNTSYYGEQAYGVEAAAQTYFGLQDTPQTTAAAQLDVAQSAMLAGIVSSPSAHDPYLHPQAALDRMQEVLGQMYLQGYITDSQRVQAIYEAEQPNFLKSAPLPPDLAPNFNYYVLKELTQILHVKMSDLSRSDLVVSTTLDLPFQNRVLKIAQQQIAALKGHNVTNAAEVAIDYRTGAIRTLLGNINPSQDQFDVASEGFRQAGSSFKPFIYVTAFEQGVSPGMPVFDGPTTFQMCCGLPPYTPHNYGGTYMGLISWRMALQNSLNIPALKLNAQIGYQNGLATAQKMGITEYTGTPNLTLVLGSLGTHLIDETSAYGSFGNNGVHVEKHAVDTIKDTWGHLIYQFSVKANSEQVVTPQAAFVMTNVLSDNVARTPEFGKCSPLWLYSTTMTQCYMGNPGIVRPAAVKTGTTNDFKDSLTVGYTPDGYVIGVWAGNDNNSAMINVTGIMGAAPIWHDAMLLVEQGRPIKNFPGPPSGVVKKTMHYPGITTTDWYIEN